VPYSNNNSFNTKITILTDNTVRLYNGARMSNSSSVLLNNILISPSNNPQIINLTANLTSDYDYVICRIVLTNYPTTCYIDDLNLTIL